MKFRGLLLIFLLAAVTLMSQTPLEPEVGEGTEDNPYQIGSLGNLYWIAASDEEVSEPVQSIRWASHYIQTADIDASETVNWFNGKGWSPIGNCWEEPFSGRYDGQWHLIDGLFINRPEEENIALFGYTIGTVAITNLVLTDIDVTGYEAVGSLVGICMDRLDIINSYASGIISGAARVGGLVGDLRASNLSNCSSNVLVNGEDNAGGLVGSMAKSIVTSSCSIGELNGGKRTGGLVGSINQSGVIDCYSRVLVRGSHSVGGLVGNLDLGSVVNSYSTGTVVANYDFGGLIGEVCSFSYEVIHSYWDVDCSGILESPAGEGRTTEEMTYPYAANTYFDWNFQEVWIEDETHSVNDGYPYLQGIVLAVDNSTIQPELVFRLRNYPNPVNPETTILYELSKSHSSLGLKIYNCRGQLVRILFENRAHGEGDYRIVWDGKGNLGEKVSSGVYFCLLIAPETRAVHRMLVIR